MLLEQTTPTAPPVPPPVRTYTPNMPGVVAFTSRLNQLGYNGTNVLSKFNEAAATSPELAAEKAAKLEALAQKLDFRGDLWSAHAPTKATATPAKAGGSPVAAVVPENQETSTKDQIGRSAWNGLLDSVTGLARTPQVLHDVSKGVLDAVGYEQSPTEIKDSQRINDGLKSLADHVGDFVSKFKADVDTSGAYDKGLVSRDDDGSFHWNGIKGAAHSIGSSLGFVGSMVGPGLAMKGAKALGMGATALRAAQAAGDVEKVAQLTKAAAGTERAMRYVGGVVSQVEPLYKDALDATGDSHLAARFAGAVAPVVAALDAFTGVEGSIAGTGRQQLSRAAIREMAQKLAKEGITEEAMTPVIKSFVSQYIKAPLKERAMEGAKQFLIEGGTEGIQEGYQMLIEKLFDSQQGNNKLVQQGGDPGARMINSLALGGVLGGGMGAAFYHTGMYHPAAFSVLQDAYRQGGSDGLATQHDELWAGIQKMQDNGEITSAEASDLSTKLDKMSNVLTSFKNPYSVDGKTQFQYYDLAYNQLPQHQSLQQDLSDQLEALANGQRLNVDEDGNFFRDEDGKPLPGSPIDPVVAATEQARLEPQLADQQRRVTYLNDMLGKLTRQGKYQDWASGFSVIGKFQPGDRVVGKDADERVDQDGTVTDISDDGQLLTVQVPGKTDGDGPATVEIRATEAKPYDDGSAPTPVQQAEQGDIAVASSLTDGFSPHRPDSVTGYKPGQRVVLADNPAKAFPVSDVSTDQDGNSVLTIQTDQGPVSGTVASLTDPSNPKRLLGSYSPEQALLTADRRAERQKLQSDLDKLQKKLPEGTRTALDAMTDAELAARYERLKADTGRADERKYIELLSQQRAISSPVGEIGMDQYQAPPIGSAAITAPDAPLAQQIDTPVDATAPDTPEVDLPLVEAEPVDDALWNQMIETDEIPVEVIAGIAARMLIDVPLSERQQIAYDKFTEEDESVLIGAMDALAQEQLNNQSDGPIQPVQTADATGTVEQSPADNSGDGAETATPAGTPVVPEPAGQPASSVAQQPVSSPDTQPVGDGSQPEPQGTRSAATPYPDGSFAAPDPATSQALAEEGSRIIADALPTQTLEVAERNEIDPYDAERRRKAAELSGPSDEEIDAQLKKLAQEEKKGKGRPKDLAAELGIDPEEIADLPLPVGPVYVGPQSDEVTPGMTVLAVLNSGSQVVGTVEGVENGLIRVAYTNRHGKPDSWTFDPSQVRNKATMNPVKLPATEGEVQRSVGGGTPAGAASLTNWVNQLSKAFPRVKVKLLTSEEISQQDRAGTKGAVKNGVVLINQDTATEDTPLHEFAHIYTATMKKYFPQLYQRGLDLVRGSDYESRVRSNEGYQNLKTDEAILEEALVTAIGEKGVSLKTPTKIQGFLTWMRLMLRRIGESLGIPLSIETTLEDFITNRAKELMGGRPITKDTSEDLSQAGVQRQRTNISPVVLPTLVDEAWLATHGENLTNDQRTELSAYETVYHPGTSRYIRQRVDMPSESAAISKQQEKIDKAGGAAVILRNRANLLDHANLGRVLFGEAPQGVEFKHLLDQQLAMVAPMEVKGHKAMKNFYLKLSGRTLFRGASSYDQVEKWPVTGLVSGQQTTIHLPVDQVVHIAAQYRTIIVSKGHFDPEHRQKLARGEQPTLGVELPNPDNPDAPIIIELNKQQLREIEDRVFYQDGATSELMADWQAHAKAMHGPVSRVYRIMTGRNLPEIESYFPIAIAATEDHLFNRKIETFVDDAWLLKERQGGAPKRIRADGFLTAVNRYQQQAQNYVQLSPLWQNLQNLAIRQKPTLVNRGLTGLHRALESQAKGYNEINSLKKPVRLFGNYDIDKIIRLATLSRFAFNIAIPMKQVTGFVSAFGSGAIDAKYLRNEGLGYLKLIAESYWLVGRGGKSGDYSGGSTEFDRMLSEIDAIGTPDAEVLVWRAQGSAHPDIQFGQNDDLSTDAGRNQVMTKIRRFFEEYGLSTTQRADTAVVFSLYKAALAQVKDQKPSMTEADQRVEAATRAKEALYFSNQTYDKTDRASIQLNKTIWSQMILLYKGQNLKILNVMARRTLELAGAAEADRPAARARLQQNLMINLVLAPAIVAAVDMAAASIRNLLSRKDNDDEDDSMLFQYTVGYLSQLLSLLPAEVGELTSGAVYLLANPESKRPLLDISPVAGFAELIGGGLTAFK